MTHHHGWLLVSAALSGCTGYGADPVDPAGDAGAGAVRVVWHSESPEGGGSFPVLTSMASDRDEAFAVTLANAGGGTPDYNRSLWEISFAGPKPRVLSEEHSSDPRRLLALSSGALYAVDVLTSNGSMGPTFQCQIASLSQSDGAAKVLGGFSITPSQQFGNASPGCDPLGIAADGPDVFVAANIEYESWLDYVYAPNLGYYGGSQGRNSQHLGEIRHFSAGGTGGPGNQILAGRVFGGRLLKNDLLVDSTSLYWVEANLSSTSGSASWTGGALMTASRAGTGLAQIRAFGSDERPTGLAQDGAYLYVSMATGGFDSGQTASASVSGCSIVQIKKQGYTSVTLASDPTQDCLDAGVDGSFLYFLTTKDASPFNTNAPPGQYTQHAVARIPLTESNVSVGALSTLRFNRSELYVQRLYVGSSSVLVVDPLYLIEVPKAALP
ncbi:MAG TPA: hypothetical protein VGJ84_20315 [Polyangiaceae bacterium]|jgi:hypothetical protein